MSALFRILCERVGVDTVTGFSSICAALSELGFSCVGSPLTAREKMLPKALGDSIAISAARMLPDSNAPIRIYYGAQEEYYAFAAPRLR